MQNANAQQNAKVAKRNRPNCDYIILKPMMEKSTTRSFRTGRSNAQARSRSQHETSTLSDKASWNNAEHEAAKLRKSEPKTPEATKTTEKVAFLPLFTHSPGKLIYTKKNLKK